MKFRSDISFLRAFSVIAVLLYHFKFSIFKGGFIGVDIFFVISGYLMTKIILNGFNKDSFNLLNFYKKRVLRIFPAMLIMISFFAILIFALIPTQFVPYLKSFFSSSLFFSNIYYYIHTGYFDSGSQFNFLLHTWSLSLEWQFYMIYPLILLTIKRFYINKRNLFYLIFFSLIISSFISMILHSQNDSSYSFYMFYPRAWEMMFGGIAFLFERSFHSLKKNLKNFITASCITILLFFITTTDSHKTIWPSLLTGIPVLATTFILLAKSDFKLFSNRIVTFLGNISYSLYLWHWPFYVLSLFFSMNDRFRHRMLFIILSLFFSILSYFLVEKRNYQRKTYQIIFASIILFITSFLYCYSKPDYNESKTAEKQYSLNDKYFDYKQTLSNYNKKNLKIDSGKKYIILLGDSHAGMFSQTINGILENSEYNLIQYTADGTYPMLNSETQYKNSKEFFNYFFQDYFPKIQSQVALVLINSNYIAYSPDQLEKKIGYTENYFKNNKVVYLGLTPNYLMDFPTYNYLKQNYDITPANEVFLKKRQIEVNNFLFEKTKGKYIDLLFHEVEPISKTGVPYMSDTNHLTLYGTEQYKYLIRRRIFEILK